MASKKILVVYYSKTGNTEKVANDIVSSLGADSEKLIDLKKRSGFFGFIFGGRDGMRKKETRIRQPAQDPSQYDIVVIGAPVWGWNMAPAVRTYLSRYKNVIKQAGYFVTCGGSGVEKTIASFEELTGQKSLACVGFSEKELKNPEDYSRKLDEFLKKLR